MDKPRPFGFRDLDVYQRSIREAACVYEKSLSFPRDDRFGLTEQIRRSSSAVAALIAEAWPRRGYRGAFANALRLAAGEVCETQCWLEHARNRGYITEDEFDALDDAWEHVNAMLYSMISKKSLFAR